jgi:hypothetical protein
MKNKFLFILLLLLAPVISCIAVNIEDDYLIRRLSAYIPEVQRLRDRIREASGSRTNREIYIKRLRNVRCCFIIFATSFSDCSRKQVQMRLENPNEGLPCIELSAWKERFINNYEKDIDYHACHDCINSKIEFDTVILSLAQFDMIGISDLLNNIKNTLFINKSRILRRRRSRELRRHRSEELRRHRSELEAAKKLFLCFFGILFPDVAAMPMINAHHIKKDHVIAWNRWYAAKGYNLFTFCKLFEMAIEHFKKTGNSFFIDSSETAS